MFKRDHKRRIVFRIHAGLEEVKHHNIFLFPFQTCHPTFQILKMHSKDISKTRLENTNRESL
jgi:hypothetical protein